RIPCSLIQAGTVSDSRTVISASRSSFGPVPTPHRSSHSSPNGYGPDQYPSAWSCTQRMFRVCRVLPPRICSQARSRISTRGARRRAVSAATSPALPPPMTTTSQGGSPSPSGAGQVSLVNQRCRSCDRDFRRDLVQVLGVGEVVGLGGSVGPVL